MVQCIRDVDFVNKLLQSMIKSMDDGGWYAYEKMLLNRLKHFGCESTELIEIVHGDEPIKFQIDSFLEHLECEI